MVYSYSLGLLFSSFIFEFSSADDFCMLLLAEENPPHHISQSDRGLWDCTVFFFFSVAILSARSFSGAMEVVLLLQSQNNRLALVIVICRGPMMVVVLSHLGPRMAQGHVWS